MAVMKFECKLGTTDKDTQGILEALSVQSSDDMSPAAKALCILCFSDQLCGKQVGCWIGPVELRETGMPVRPFSTILLSSSTTGPQKVQTFVPRSLSKPFRRLFASV